MRILVVDDEPEERQYVASLATGFGHQVIEAINGRQALERLGEQMVAVMVTDLRMPHMDGLELIRELRKQGNLPPTLVLTGFGSLDLAVSTVHELGAFWFLEKPVDAKSLQVLLDRAGAHGRLEKEVQALRRELSFQGAVGDMVGQSGPMQEVFAMIRQVAPTNVSVLITGESGTGKELVARAIHDQSQRANHPFVAVNCAALPESLIESELFGHEKGSFTGAFERRIGCLEMAESGTLFLDEIGEMPVAMQAKLLRVLEDLRFRRIGGKQELTADVRIVAATNRDPKAAIADGRLREDVYYRLSVFHVELPPLRQRLDDLPILTRAMIERLNAKYQSRVPGISDKAMELLQSRAWAGNVRELRNAIERAVILAGEGMLEVHHFAAIAATAAAPVDGNRVNIRVGFTVEEAERQLIEATLEHTGNNKTRAASILGISTKTLHVKLRQYRGESAEDA
jgi:DNA-binding NtrC family response regulator